MSNEKRFDIDILLNAETAQAEEAKRALEDISESTRKASGANKDNADSMRTMGDRSQGAMDAIEGLTRASQGGIGAIGDMDLAIRGLSDIVFGGGPFALIAGGLAAVVTSAVVAVKHLQDVKREIREAGDESAAAREKFTALDQIEIDFTADIEQLTRLVTQFAAANSQADALLAARNRLHEAQAALSLQQIDADEANELAGTSSDRQRQAIRLKHQARRTEVSAGAELERASGDFDASREVLNRIDKNIEQLNTNLATNLAQREATEAARSGAFSRAEELGIESDQALRLKRLDELNRKDPKEMTFEEIQERTKYKSFAPEDRQSLATHSGLTYAETQIRLEKERAVQQRTLDQERKAQAQLEAMAGMAGDGNFELTPSQAQREAVSRIDTLDSALRLIAELPDIIEQSAASMEQLKQETAQLEADIQAQHAAAIPARIDINAAATRVRTAQAKSQTASTTQSMAETDFTREVETENLKAELEEKLRALQEREKELKEKERRGFPELEDRYNREQAQAADAQESLDEFREDPRGPRNLRLSPMGRPFQAELARQTAERDQQLEEANEALKGWRQANEQLVSTIKQLAQEQKNLQSQIDNIDN